MNRHLLALVPLTLSACGGSLPQVSDRYAPEPQTSATQECLVTAARQVQVIGGQSGAPDAIGGHSAAPRPLGTITGQRDTLAQSDAPYRLSGGVIGGSAGMDQSPVRSQRPPILPASVEYRVQEGNSERVIVQSIDYSGVVLPAGTPCRLVGSGSDTRVTWG